MERQTSQRMTSHETSARTEWVRSALDQYSGPLTRYAARITGDPDRARDAVQETFIRLCAVEQSQVDGHLPEWLFTVCRNRALDSRRKESRMQTLTDEQLNASATEEPSPAAVAEQRETSNRVLRILGTLPPNQQEVIRLKFQNDLSYKEISRVTKFTVTNVGFLIHTGMKTLRARLQTDLPLTPGPVL